MNKSTAEEIRNIPGILPLRVLATDKRMVNNKIQWVHYLWNTERLSVTTRNFDLGSVVWTVTTFEQKCDSTEFFCKVKLLSTEWGKEKNNWMEVGS